jgi:hypothetical protein
MTASGPNGKATKERVLHTRVPEALEREIKALADSLRLPVSSLVRNILEDSMRALEAAASRGLSEVQTMIEQSLRARSSKERPPVEFADVIGWQSLTLNQPATCARCRADLSAGDAAHLGVRERPGPRLLICPRCLPQPKKERDLI